MIDQQVATIQLPTGLRYDGHMMNRFAQFTELDKTVASYGASFYLEDGDITTDSLNAKRISVREKFANG